jgi:hypothetical protein
MKKITTTIVVAGLLFAACKKHTPTIAPQRTGDSKTTLLAKFRAINANISKKARNARKTDVINYVNTLNPYDSVGYFHNQLLDYLQPYLDATHDTDSVLTIVQDGRSYNYTSYVNKTIAVVAKYAHENNFNFGSANNLSLSYSDIYNNISVFYNNQTPSGISPASLRHFCDDGSSESTSLDYYTKWVTAAYSGSTFDDSLQLLLRDGLHTITTESIGTPEDIENSALALIIQYEDTLIAHQGDINPGSYKSELLGFAVMRYSNYYWYNVSNTPSSKWAYYYAGILFGTNNNSGFHRTTSWAGAWHGFCVGAADGMGGVIGAGGTAPTGPGAIVGAIIGAGIGSGLMESCFS